MVVSTITDTILDGFLIGAVAAAVGAFIDLLVTNMTLKDNLDSKSEWRKELFNVASKERVTFDSINTLRATLRYKPKTTTKHHLSLLVKVRKWSWIFVIIIGCLDLFLLAIKFIPKILSKQECVTQLPKFPEISGKLTLFSIGILIIVILLNRFYSKKISKIKKRLGYEKIKLENIPNIPNFSTIYISNTGTLDNEETNKEAFEAEIDVMNLIDLAEKIKTSEYSFDNIPLFYFNFDSITKTIIDFCAKTEILDNKTARMVKIYTLYMLKHHWEELSVPEYRFIKKIETRVRNNEIIKDLINEIANGNSPEKSFGVPPTNHVLKFRKVPIESRPQ